MNRIFILNPKGGSGKSTIAIHSAVGFAALGYKVLLVDSDVEQLTSYTFYLSRKILSESLTGELTVQLPLFHCEKVEVEKLVNFVLLQSKNYDFIIVDSPGSSLQNYTSDIIAAADTIIAPINESFVDLQALRDSLFFSELCKMKERSVLGTQNKRNITIVTTRRSPLWSNHQEEFYEQLSLIKKKHNIDFIEGFFESISFKEMFRKGLTILDHPYLNTVPSNVQRKAIQSIKHYIKYIVQKMLTNQYLS
jgi:chromosome partitioning protein